MVERQTGTEGSVAAEAQPPAAPRRSAGVRGEPRDAAADLAVRAQQISSEAGTRMTGAMRDVIQAAGGLSGFVIETARDVVQFMVRRGQMAADEAEALLRDAEEAYRQRVAAGKVPLPPAPPPSPRPPPAPPPRAADRPLPPAPVPPAAERPAAERPAAERPAEGAADRPVAPKRAARIDADPAADAAPRAAAAAAAPAPAEARRRRHPQHLCDLRPSRPCDPRRRRRSARRRRTWPDRPRRHRRRPRPRRRLARRPSRRPRRRPSRP
jgi:hypothetical protein